MIHILKSDSRDSNHFKIFKLFSPCKKTSSKFVDFSFHFDNISKLAVSFLNAQKLTIAEIKMYKFSYTWVMLVYVECFSAILVKIFSKTLKTAKGKRIIFSFFMQVFYKNCFSICLFYYDCQIYLIAKLLFSFFFITPRRINTKIS